MPPSAIATLIRPLRTLARMSTVAPSPTPAAGAGVKILSHNQYSTPRLLPSSLSPSPLTQFSAWLAGALDPVAAGEPEGTPAVHEPEAMTLGTVGEGGRISGRVVLLKGELSPGQLEEGIGGRDRGPAGTLQVLP